MNIRNITSNIHGTSESSLYYFDILYYKAQEKNINNAMIINSVGVFWQGIVIGLVLLLAVSLDAYKGTTR